MTTREVLENTAILLLCGALGAFIVGGSWLILVEVAFILVAIVDACEVFLPISLAAVGVFGFVFGLALAISEGAKDD